ncbi:hypothetical protein EEL53_10145 [Muribaculaceae bacterium Isolate-114 (HZI)]|nr:hypothetical protein EEL53_10145 [Muribaculaceae bacterium Isolate-114 (HZI)]
MKIYVIQGYGYDPTESKIETYAIVCMSREDAERQLDMIIEEQTMIARSETYCGIEYVETIRKRNGKVSHYKIEMIYNLRNQEHKEAFLWSTLVIGGNIKNDEFHPVMDDGDSPEYRIMTQASITIREQEIG